MRIAPYILAGGMSSRMGRDKAMIALGGETMLARAVEKLRLVYPPEFVAYRREVTVIGQRALLEGADRTVPDNYPGCGPLAGIEAALGDLEKTRVADWAMFLPVDMPFLPVNLIDALLREWTAAATDGARVCLVVIDGRPQPLVSLVHREVHPFLKLALEGREFRVTPVLQSACNALASLEAGELTFSRPVLWQTRFTLDEISPIDRVWSCTALERRSRHLWFANLNTEADLQEAETFLWKQGSIGGQAEISD